MDYRDIITLDRTSRSFRITGLQVGVADVLHRLASGMPEAAILAEFPFLTPEHIRACLAFRRDHINGVRHITTENPSAEVWKYLRFFLDGPAVARAIRAFHGIPPKLQKKNITKQAQQIGYCIRQAEQYFTASAQVGLPTRPVLLYYGAVSLSQALILLKKDGTCSLDVRRRDRQHNHHGLELARGLAETAAQATSPQGFLEKIECTCHSRDLQPRGHFALFYRSLVPSSTTIHAQIHTAEKSSFLECDIPIHAPDLLSLDCIASRGFGAWDLFKGLPDLYFSLAELGVTSKLCRGSAKRQINRIVFPKPLNQHGGDPVTRPAPDAAPDRVQYIDSFFLDGITPAQKEAFLEFYRQRNPAIRLMDDVGPNIHLSLAVDAANEEAALEQMGYYPDIAEDLAGRKYYIIDPDDYLPEPAAILALLFCFSMLCRYYPDVWVKSIDENIRMAELMNVFLNIAYRKFPNLILDQLTLTKHKIHL